MATEPVTQAAAYSLVIMQGSTLSLVLRMTDAAGDAIALDDVSSVDAVIREDFAASGVLETMSASVTNASQGEITIALTSAETAAMDVPAGTADDVREAKIGYWDLEITTTGGEVYRYIEGEVTLSREVTT